MFLTKKSFPSNSETRFSRLVGGSFPSNSETRFSPTSRGGSYPSRARQGSPDSSGGSYLFTFLLFLVLATPLFGLHLVVSNPGFDKAVWFFLALDLAVLVYLWTVGGFRGRWRFSPIDFLVLGLVAVLALSTLFSVNPLESFWGSFDRFEGLIVFIHLLLFYFLLRSAGEAGLFRWETVFNLHIGVAVLVSIYALLERLTPLGGWLTPIEGGRISATLGNPNLLGGYLALTLILTLAQLKESKRLRLLYTGALILQFLALAFSGSRASLVAFIVGTLIFVLYSGWLDWRRLNKKLALALLGAAVILVIPFTTFTSFGQRLVRPPWQDVSFVNRVNGWVVTLQAVPKRPLFGWGLEQYERVFDSSYQPKFGQYVNQPTWFDRAHNVVVEFLVQTGVLGLLAYLGLIFLPFYFLARRRLLKESLVLAGGLILGVSFLQNLFNFDSLSSYLVIFTVLAFLAGQLLLPIKKLRSSEKGTALPHLALAFFALVSIAITVFLALGYYQAVAADELIKGRQFASAQAKLTPWVGRHPLSPGFLRISSLFLQHRLKNDILSEKEAEEAAELVRFIDNQAFPMLDKSTRLTYTLAGLNFSLAKLGSESAFEVGNALYQKVLSQMPNNETLYWAWGRELANLGYWSEADQLFDKAIALNSNFATAHLWKALATIYRKDFSTAQELLEEHAELRKYYTTDAQYLALVARAYIGTGRYDLAIWWYEENRVPEMDNLDYRFHLATLYFAVKDYGRSAEQVKYVLEKNSAYKGAQELWQELRKVKPDLE